MTGYPPTAKNTSFLIKFGGLKLFSSFFPNVLIRPMLLTLLTILSTKEFSIHSRSTATPTVWSFLKCLIALVIKFSDTHSMSASIKQIISPFDFLAPWFLAFAGHLGMFSIMTIAPFSLARSTVPSVEPPSTTKISLFGYGSLFRLSINLPIVVSSFKAGMIIETFANN